MALFIVQQDKYRKVMEKRQIKMRERERERGEGVRV
jgi:hypothetical protein